MTIRQMNDFVRQRLDPVLQLPYYRAIIDPNMNSINAKRIRNSNMSFRTSSKPGSVEGLNVDMVSIDEFDRANIQAIQSAENSMSSSKFKVSRKWSTPTAPNVGIHDLFVHSDQMEYIHKCQHCGYWNLLNYADYVDDGDPHSGGNIRLLNPDGINLAARAVMPGTYQFVCAKCGKPLDRWYSGTWGARYPSRTQDTNGTRGYHISQMNAVWITADALKTAELNAKSKQAFYNYNLGMPYQDTKLQVSDADVKDHATFPKRRLNRDGYQLVAVGIDWGEQYHHCVVMGMRANGAYDMLNVFKVKAVGATNVVGSGSDIMAIKLKLRNYDPDIIIADVGDAGEKIHALMEIYGQDKVYGGKYSSNPTAGLYAASGKFETTWSDTTNTATMDKLTQNKRFIDLMKRGMIGFWEQDDEELETYIKHWQNVFIRDDEQDDGSFRQVIGRRGGDHYAQASVICLEALDYIRKQVYSEDSYDFSYTDLDTRMKPDNPDIVNRLKESGNIFE